MKTNQTFERNDKCYLADGTVAYFVADIGDGEAVVSLQVAGEYYDPLEPDTRDVFLVVGRVFEQPPLHEVSAEIEEARKELASILERQELELERLAEFEKTYRERHAALSKWEGLRLLEDFLEKRITHVVLVNYHSAKIMTFEEALAYREDRGRSKGFKLLSLFGRSNGVLEWQVNEYYDGSGSHTQIYPANSFEDAVAQCRKLFDGDMAEAVSDPNKIYYVGNWLEMAANYEWTITESLMSQYRQRQVANATENVEKTRKLLAEQEATLAKALGT